MTCSKTRDRLLRPAILRGKIAPLLAVTIFAACAAGAAPLPAPSHTVIVVLENRSAAQVYDNPDMPFFNALARQGALMSNAGFAQTPYGRIPRGYSEPLPARPSQPNYLYLISASNQGVVPEYFAVPTSDPAYPYRGAATNDTNGDLLPAPRADVPTGIANRLVPPSIRPFTTPNLGAAVIAHGGSFACFSESLPYPRYDEETFRANDGLYKRKHNPVINWINLPRRSLSPEQIQFTLPETANLGFDRTRDPNSRRTFRGFAVDEAGKPIAFDNLPTVAFVVPNQNHDAHDASLRDADRWLQENIGPYAAWAMKNNALLVLTFDEDGATKKTGGNPYQTGADKIATVFYGPMVKPGRYDEPVDHLNVLSTLLALHADLATFRKDFARAHPDAEGEREGANLRPILDIFDAGPPLAPLPRAARD